VKGLSQQLPPPELKKGLSKKMKIAVLIIALSALLLMSIGGAFYFGFLRFPTSTPSQNTPPDISGVRIIRNVTRSYSQYGGMGFYKGAPIDNYDIYALIDIIISNPTNCSVIMKIKGEANVTVSYRITGDDYGGWSSLEEQTENFTVSPYSENTYTITLLHTWKNTDYPNTIGVTFYQPMVKELHREPAP